MKAAWLSEKINRKMGLASPLPSWPLRALVLGPPTWKRGGQPSSSVSFLPAPSLQVTRNFSARPLAEL